MFFLVYVVTFLYTGPCWLSEDSVPASFSFLSSCLQLLCLTQKAIGFHTGGSYIKHGLSVGWAIKSAISVFILGFRKAQRETPPQFILRKSPSQHFRTRSKVFNREGPRDRSPEVAKCQDHGDRLYGFL